MGLPFLSKCHSKYHYTRRVSLHTRQVSQTKRKGQGWWEGEVVSVMVTESTAVVGERVSPPTNCYRNCEHRTLVDLYLNRVNLITRGNFLQLVQGLQQSTRWWPAQMPFVRPVYPSSSCIECWLLIAHSYLFSRKQCPQMMTAISPRRVPSSKRQH